MASAHLLPTLVGEAIAKLAESLADVLGQGEGQPFEEREAQVGRALNAVGQAAMKAMLTAADPAGRDIELSDGTRYWQAARAEREYLSSFGPVRVERGVYRSVRNGPTVCPMELRTGIVEHFWTRRAAWLAVLAVVDMTSYRASEFFAQLGGMRPSRSSLDRLPRALCGRWEANREDFEQRVREAATIPAEAVSVAVSLDGVMVAMRSGCKHEKKAQTRASGRPDKGPAGYREAGCGSVSYYDCHGERLQTVRFGRMPEAKMATLENSLRAELAHVRALRPELTVVAVADGDPVLWEFLDSLKPDETVVDFFHAAEHLKLALDLTDEPSTVATQKRFATLRHRLMTERDGAQCVVRALSRRLPRRTTQVALGRRGISYFKRHAHRMNYPRLTRRRLPVGSGVVEGTCRWLVSDRMKRTGMRWDREGGQAILTLRALSHSDRLDAAWPHLVGDSPTCRLA